MLKIIEEHFELEDNNNLKNVQGPKGSTPTAQAPPSPVSTTSNTELAPEADKFLRHMTTDEGSSVRRGVADTNGK
jgi:hypothetical protein